VYNTQTTVNGATAAMTQAVNDGSVLTGAAGSPNILAAASITKEN